jgi:hypothetical protein
LLYFLLNQITSVTTYSSEPAPRKSVEPILNEEKQLRRMSSPHFTSSQGGGSFYDNCSDKNEKGKEVEKRRGKGDVIKKGKGIEKEVINKKKDEDSGSEKEEDVEERKEEQKKSRIEEPEGRYSSSRSSRSSIDVADELTNKPIKNSNKRLSSKDKDQNPDILIPSFKEHRTVVLPDSLKGRRSERICEQEVF